MTSRKYEKAEQRTSFWKKSALEALPGRPNPRPPAATTLLSSGPKSSSSPSSSSSSASRDVAPVVSSPVALPAAMPSSFVAYEASVSDAWTVQEDASAQRSIMPSASTTTSSSPATSSSATGSRTEKLERVLLSEGVDLDTLRKLSWSGLPPRLRPKAWKILCGYLPGAIGRQAEVMHRKQEEYAQYVSQYFLTKDQDVHQDTYRQIHIDIPRMSPVIALFQQKPVQEIFERILYIWAIRHPASGYVQGINDLVTPFFLVFLQDHVGTSVADISELEVAAALTTDQVSSIEADAFWCLTKVLDGIQDNYTFAQPGIQLKVKQLEELVCRIDRDLYDHLTNNEVLFIQFAFRWMNNILMRELPIKATIRLWDTYLSEIEGFSHFHLYVCAAFLIHWKTELMKKRDFHTLLMFLQNLPTAKWSDGEINLLVAEAYRISYLFADAPSHLAK